jgi:hypothetical protein
MTGRTEDITQQVAAVNVGILMGRSVSLAPASAVRSSAFDIHFVLQSI